MNEMQILPIESMGREFVPSAFLPEGQDEYYLRNAQSRRSPQEWRSLKAEEIEALVRNRNTADKWDNILVTEQFTPNLIRNCEFYGLVRIGRLEEVHMAYHDLTVPVGLTNSRIISCDIGDDVAIHSVRYLSHYIIGDNVILLNIDEMHTSNHAKFGNGIIKDGEEEDVRIWMALINEYGGRSVMPFDGMTPGDAYLWAKYRDDAKLMARLGEITQRQFDPRRGFYGTVGDKCVIKNSRIIKDVKVGAHAYIKGANKLKNLTINSSRQEPSQIGEGVEMVNGIIGYGCHVFYGCKAVRFVMGDCTNLKYGARLIHSYLGDNSTISCCEVLYDLIFPAHEQHHNNSFLTAALVKGQCNIAAGATMGSNHNSRSSDGEIEAGRGFWPGLCVSLKHFCRFASFVLLGRGDYPAEMDIPLPFSLVSNDTAGERLVVMPAYWWMYNMYALARNAGKFRARDKRLRKIQNIEFDTLAPDTAEEIFACLRLLERWTGRAKLRAEGKPADAADEGALAELGRELLTEPVEGVDGLEILGENVENSRRKVVILKVHQAYRAYLQMLHYYAVKGVLAHMQDNPSADLAATCKALGGQRQKQWVNLGGQLIPAEDVEQIKADINSGELDSWPAIHERYDQLWQRYPLDKQRHALATLADLSAAGKITPEVWSSALDEAIEIQQYICRQTYVTRQKDYDNPFRRITFANEAEMTAVMGTAEDNSFVKQVQQETQDFERLIEAVRKRG